MSTIVSHSPLNISETVRHRGLLPNDHQHEMAYMYREIKRSRDRWRHVTRKFKLMTPIRLERNILRTSIEVLF